MTIKEVEEKVGIKKTNIRFYEEAGLLRPERSKENNYRIYSQADVDILEKIKFLRSLRNLCRRYPPDWNKKRFLLKN